LRHQNIQSPEKEFVLQIGIDSFAASIPDPVTGVALSPTQRMQHLLEEITLADQSGLDVFGIGEHHRPSFSIRHLQSFSERQPRLPNVSA
jgi:hypothetical protein